MLCFASAQDRTNPRRIKGYFTANAPYSPELQPAEHLWPVLDEPLANQYFATLADLEHVVTARCRVLNADQLKPGTNFHWWPKPDIPV
jgi:transposase